MQNQLIFDVIVVGSGPAGITAAIYLKMANLNVLMIDSNAPGGQVNKISVIENYPGFSHISGADLAYNMFAQTQDLDIPYKYGKVVDIINDGNQKIIKTEKESLQCKVVIIATGRKPKELGLPNEKNLIGKGISWCAICDGALFKNKDVIVVGGGNSALEESLYLSNIANKVSIIHRSKELSCDEIFKDRVLKSPKINIYHNAEVIKLNVFENKLESVEIEQLGEKQKVSASGVFIYIGFEPSIFYAEGLDLDVHDGYINVDKDMRTNVAGVYACGDVIKKDLYQITTAISDGSVAATSAIKYLKEIE
ncbi:MAG: FAD-dependent oxidoreductase [Bacilli bacterium]|nr:FAD-dependent oxidoreductase [Bacilli bacterium]MDD3304696.1 FAD-dependent oxidoreductase [Bacilli bacterium]MDD4053252.1 FAD-dependent oxidoreductase [Bacilli bacterium]MDD4411224.1 FAD-dependent oxidoreductase [Bacilli bacterium]